MLGLSFHTSASGVTVVIFHGILRQCRTRQCDQGSNEQNLFHESPPWLPESLILNTACDAVYSAFPGYQHYCCARTIRATTYMKASECSLNRHSNSGIGERYCLVVKHHSNNFPLDRRQVLPKL
jgi:hypothetical protein